MTGLPEDVTKGKKKRNLFLIVIKNIYFENI